MKVIAYSIKPFEKELLDKANQQRHEIRYITAELSLGTAEYARGYEVALVFITDDVSAPVLEILARSGIKFVITRSVGTDHIDINTAKQLGIEVLNVPAYSPQTVAEHSVALALALARKLIPAFDNCRKFNFKIDNFIGFRFYEKTVGIVGLGNIGLATAGIYKGMGCKVLGYDVISKSVDGIEMVDLDTLLEQSDIVSLHVPLNVDTHYLIDKEKLAKMKRGVMLINTSRGAVLKTADAIEALTSGKLGYLGLDVYEHEKDLFFEDHQFVTFKDPLLLKLLILPNVLITPHIAFLTTEAITDIAYSVIKNLDELVPQVS